jgi:phosphatidyl-myo-inositol dimannoside synthase
MLPVAVIVGPLMTTDAKPRLLVPTPDFPPAFGGIQLLVSRVVENLTRFDIRVVTLDHPGAEAFDRANGIGVKRVRTSRLPKTTNVLFNSAIVREARRFRPHLCLSGHVVGAPATALLSASAGIPFVQYLHADELADRPRLTTLAVTRAAANIAVSRYTGQLALDAGSDAERVHRIPPGVDLPTGARAERSEQPTVLSLARLTDRYKGHDVLIKGLARIRASVPEARMVFVGDGPLRPGLEQLAHAEGVAESMVFTGSVSDEERDAWLDRAHVFTMPSRLPPNGRGGEGFGIVYLEAGAHGLPVVAGNVAGALDAVVDGETGTLVDPANPEAVADALIELLLDPARAEKLGRAGAVRAQEFAWPKIAARVEDLLLETVQARRRA